MENLVTPKLKNYVLMILDKSGSMTALQNEIVGGFNDQLKVIREENTKYGMKSLVSLVTFSSRVDTPIAWLEDIDTIKELTAEEYKPDGMTAMYDAIGDSIEKLMQVPDANDEGTAFLVIIISDGQENNSTKYTGQKIAELIDSCQKTGRWTFTYIGANQDLSQVSKHLNIDVNNTLRFAATAAGVNMMESDMSMGTSTYYASRSRGITSLKSMYIDKQDDKKDDQDKTI
jgi:Mg-chelatase subunit ChlD